MCYITYVEYGENSKDAERKKIKINCYMLFRPWVKCYNNSRQNAESQREVVGAGFQWSIAPVIIPVCYLSLLLTNQKKHTWTSVQM